MLHKNFSFLDLEKTVSSVFKSLELVIKCHALATAKLPFLDTTV